MRTDAWWRGGVADSAGGCWLRHLGLSGVLVLGACTSELVTAPPLITLSQTKISFYAVLAGANPNLQVDSVGTGGAGPLMGLAVGGITYGAGQPSGWLSASLSVSAAPAALTLGVMSGNLAVGTYAATVSVTAAGAADSPQLVTVTLTVTAGPLISLAKSTVTFSAELGGVNPSAQMDSVYNATGGALSGLAVGAITYGAAQPTGWLNATLSATTTPAALMLTVTARALVAGTYTATVPVTASAAANSPQLVTVTLTISTGSTEPLISLTQPTVTFLAEPGGVSPSAQVDSVYNGGGGTLSGLAVGGITYGVGQPTGWLGATLSGTTAPAALLFTVTTTTLAAGTYTATVPLTANGTSNSPNTVEVAFTLSTTLTNLYVPNLDSNSITVYPPGANGNVTPIAKIAGSNTGLNSPDAIALDGAHHLYVVNNVPASLTIYASGASGNVAPTATIAGSNTTLNAPKGLALDGSGNMYVVSFPGVGIYTPEIAIFAAGASGNATPTATIAGSNTELGNPIGVAVDQEGNVYVTDLDINVGNFRVEVFAAGASGNVTPMATITGGNTQLNTPYGITVDAAGNIYVVNGEHIAVFGAGANGNATPTALIQGSNTGLSDGTGIALDAAGHIYVGNARNNSITVYAAGASGNATPIATIEGSNTGLGYPYFIGF